MNCLVFGRTGQVARELGLQADVLALGREDVDLTDPAACAAAIMAHKPTAVINAAAFTAVVAALCALALLAAGLWLFATRLSRRVQKLSGAVNRAMDDAGQSPELPSTTSGDEVGELARNTEKLLKAVAEYNAYLQKLAGRLSHELKTPIAITRSSLANSAVIRRAASGSPRLSR